jgi:DNA processing protein
MNVNKVTTDHSSFPSRLRTIPQPPKQLYYRGDIGGLDDRKLVSIVGSRAVTPYGRQITTKFASELAKHNIVVVSGLALGVDALAHQAALDAGGRTIAVLPSPVDKVYPASNRQLAEQIILKGGALLSEYGEDDRSEAFKARFIERNRLVSGLADVLLITEASEKSGTMHTVNFALEQGRTVMAVPGNITSPTSSGTNNLIKAGALPVTDISDILSAIGLDGKTEQLQILAANQDEQVLLDLLMNGVTDATELLEQSGLALVVFNQTLTMLEITGKIRPLGAGHWSIK